MLVSTFVMSVLLGIEVGHRYSPSIDEQAKMQAMKQCNESYHLRGQLLAEPSFLFYSHASEISPDCRKTQ